MLQQKSCFLKSLDNSSVNILLEDKQEVILGRCSETNITDKRCSKKQVSLLADCKSETVTVKHVGANPCSANGIILRKDVHILNNSETLDFLVGKYQFQICFNTGSDKTEKRKNLVTMENGSSDSKRFCKEANINPKKVSACDTNLWEKIDDGKLYIFTSAGVKSSAKIAAYDLDGTIIKTKSGRVFPKDRDDWVIANANVIAKLSKYIKEGYKIVILTNQAGIGRGQMPVENFKYKIENIVGVLNLPVQVFIATSTSIYRKPAPGMWTYLENKKNDGIKIDMTVSFYVGDAAGRIANWSPGKKKDFSSADRLLALNLKLHFFTPEENFSNEHPGKFVLPEFNPAALEDKGLGDGEIIIRGKEVVILVGYPGSGKTHFAVKHLVPAGYVHVNRDILGSWQKCVLNMESALAAGRSVVIDNTNPDRSSRKRFIERASVPCRCFLMTTTLDHVRHNIRFRELTDRKHVPVNEMIVHSYKNKFETPSLEEGFSQIININFVPSFSDPELKKLYQMYLLEK